MAKDNKVKVSLSLAPRTLAQLDEYAGVFHLSRSAFVDLMVSQVAQVLNVAGLEVKKSDAAESGDD